MWNKLNPSPVKSKKTEMNESELNKKNFLVKSDYLNYAEVVSYGNAELKIKNQIRFAMEFHELLMDICGYADKAFESQMFCSITVSFLVTLFCLYGALYTISNPMPHTTNSELIVLLFFLREIAVHAVPTLVLIHICGKIIRKADEIEKIVYKMMRFNTNDNLQNILLNFLLQTQNLKPRFAPYGLFEVNKQLITVMVGTITTYFVILIQFSSEDYKKGSSA